MMSRHVLLAGLGLVLAPCAIVFAQADLPLQFLYRDTGWTISVGARSISKTADVTFSNLGTVAANRSVSLADESKIYNDGQVLIDAPRTTEFDLNGNVYTVPGTRFDTTRYDENGNVVVSGNYIAYTPGVSRSWAYSSSDQVTADGRIGMSVFSATSDGASAKDDGTASTGVEIALGRRLGRLSPGIEWGLSASVGLSDFNRKASGRVASTLHAITDYYSLNGQPAPEPPYTAPTFADLLDADGNVLATGTYETTTVISTTPTNRTETSTPGAAQIDGNWRLKGAYYLMRLGPSLRARLGEKFAFSASAGVAGALVGATYRAEEKLLITGLTDSIDTTEESTRDEFITGFYGEVTAEYWFTPRTGIYAGLSYESLDKFEQMVGSRRAEVDLGASTGFRIGVITRF